jgi:hypothetical protein
VEVVYDITPLSYDPPPSAFGPKEGYEYDKLFDSFNLPVFSGEDTEMVFSHLINHEEVDDGWRTSIPTNVSSSNTAEGSVAAQQYVANGPNPDDSESESEAEQDFPTHVSSNPNGAESSSRASLEGEHNLGLGDELTVPAVPSTRIHKDHPVDQILGSPVAGVRTRHQLSLSENQCLFSEIQGGEGYIKSLHECFISQIEPKNYQMAL